MPGEARARGAGETSERATFDTLYRRHADAIYRYCLRRTGDAELAEDARAIVFMEAWRRRRDVDLATRPVAPWLYGVARNVLRNQRRASRRREVAVEHWGRVRAGLGADVTEQVERRQQIDALLRSLRTLPAGQRDVVGLCLLEDRSYEAAAGTLRVPVGTVRSRLSRARVQLALVLRAAEGEPTPPTT